MSNERILVVGVGRMAALIASYLEALGYEVNACGRDRERVLDFSRNTGIPSTVVPITARGLTAALEGCFCVINTAGPIIDTAVPVVEAALETRTHYLDISNEYGVLGAALQYDREAAIRNVVLAPGVAFGVAAAEYVVQIAAGYSPSVHSIDVAITTAPSSSSTPAVQATLKRTIDRGLTVIREGKLVHLKTRDLWSNVDPRALPLRSGALEALDHGSSALDVSVGYRTEPGFSDGDRGAVIKVLVTHSDRRGTLLEKVIPDPQRFTLDIVRSAIVTISSESPEGGVLTPRQLIGADRLEKVSLP